MSFETLTSWILLLIFLIPLIWVGVITVVKTTDLKRIELIIPCSVILGISIFIFLLNTFSFFIKGEIGVFFSYFIFILFGFALLKVKNGESKAFVINRKSLLLFLLSLLSWGYLIFWKGNRALIGGDTTLYYSIAHSFLRGNFPLLTPWQSDLALSYHLGIFEFLGAAHLITNINFEFLHIFFSSLFIVCASQIIIWIIRRDDSFKSFLLGNLAAGVGLISFGFISIILPNFPIKFPEVTNFHQLFLWIRGLPSVYDAIEIYGAAVNLDSLIYFIFHSFGLALFLALAVVIIHPKKYRPLFSMVNLAVGLSVLALSNGSIFIAAAPALILSCLIIYHRKKILLKNVKLILITFLLTFFAIVIQGGAITVNLLTNSNLDSSVLFFPKKEQIKEDFQAYHYYQMTSKQLPLKGEWMPFRWYHVGVDVLIVVALALLIFVKSTFGEKIIILTVFITGIFSLLAYNFVVPKYLIANGNRFLAFSYIFLSLSIIYSLVPFIQRLLNKRKPILWGFAIVISFWILAPTILSPLALLSKTRFGENKLIPTAEQPSAGIEWIKNNIPYNEKVMVLDLRAPHPSGVAKVLVEAGVFSPIFPGNFRAYTIEASPEYIDIAYTLSPTALNRLKISTILIDSSFYQTLPEGRRYQLDNEKYFIKIFDNSNNRTNWERLYRVQDEYLKNGGELDGTLEELSDILPKQAKIYIDNEENFKYDFLRRPVIFIVRDMDLYFNPQSGVYLNVEAYINQKNPQKDIKYDFLILGEKTKPQDACNCNANLIWKGLKDEVYLWRSEYFGKVEK